MSYVSDYPSGEPTRAEVDAFAGATLLEFGAPWCPHCQAVQPQLSQLLKGGVRHLKVEDGRGKPLGRSFAVKIWPNLVFVRDGQVLAQLARPTAREIESAYQLLSNDR